MEHEEVYCGYCTEGEMNWNNEPLLITQHDEMGVPLCPSCGEWTYSGTRCPFCGQKFIFPKKRTPMKTRLEGARWNKDGKAECNQCGGTDFSLVGFSDGVAAHGFVYSCKNCRNSIDFEYVDQ